MIERIVDYSDGTHREEFAYGVTSLTAQKASSDRLLELVRGHWEIENRVHYVRDMTFDEDRSQIRKGNGPRIMASIRNLVISLFRLVGFKSIPEAIRHFMMRLEDTMLLVGWKRCQASRLCPLELVQVKEEQEKPYLQYKS